MAVTSIWPIKGRVDVILKYASNPEKTVESNYINQSELHAVDNVIEYAADEMKTEKRMYVSGIGCNEYNAVERFKTTLNTCGDKGKRVCYHGYQSFKENEVDAETAHEIGKALAENLWGDKYQVLVATHCNTGHYHNHFIICATSYKDGTKFHNGKDDYRRMREESDRLCKEYGLSVIRNPKAKGKSYAEWRAEFEGRPTVRGTIREAIDIAISGSANKREFLDAMDQVGFIIDQSGKYPKIKHVGGERFVRFNSLGPGYSPEEIVDRIMSNDYPEFPEVPPQESPQQIFAGQNKPVASMNYTAVYHCFVTALKITTERPQTNKKMSFRVREDQGKMRSYSDQLMMLTEHKIENREQLLVYREKALSQIPEVIKLRQDMRNALKRAIRAGDETMINKTKYNIDIYTRQLKKLRREINACDGVLERMDSVREKLADSVCARYVPKDDAIYIRQGLDGYDIFRSLSQEIVIANFAKNGVKREDCAFTAYCASFVLCERNGFDTGDFDFEKVPERFRHTIRRSAFAKHMKPVKSTTIRFRILWRRQSPIKSRNSSFPLTG